MITPYDIPADPAFRALYPEMSDREFDAMLERIDRYIRLVWEIIEGLEKSDPDKLSMMIVEGRVQRRLHAQYQEPRIAPLRPYPVRYRDRSYIHLIQGLGVEIPVEVRLAAMEVDRRCSRPSDISLDRPIPYRKLV